VHVLMTEFSFKCAKLERVILSLYDLHLPDRAEHYLFFR